MGLAHTQGICYWGNFGHSCDMSKKLHASPAPIPDCAKELEHLYAQLAAVEALIRALEIYRRFYPNLVPSKRKSA